jgi:hypothetical protein
LRIVNAAYALVWQITEAPFPGAFSSLTWAAGKAPCGPFLQDLATPIPFAPYGDESRHDRRAEKKTQQSERLHSADDS